MVSNVEEDSSDSSFWVGDSLNNILTKCYGNFLPVWGLNIESAAAVFITDL